MDDDDDDDMSTEEESPSSEMPKPIFRANKTPEKKAETSTEKKSVEFSPLQLQGDYEDDVKMMTQEQVDVL